MTNIPIGPGTEIRLDLLTWHEPSWQFGHPSAVLAPTICTWENGRSIEGMIEDYCIQACVDRVLMSEPITHGVVGRRWRVVTLRNRFREALAGRRFREKAYRAARVRVRFGFDCDGELDFALLDRPRLEVAP